MLESYSSAVRISAAALSGLAVVGNCWRERRHCLYGISLYSNFQLFTGLIGRKASQVVLTILSTTERTHNKFLSSQGSSLKYSKWNIENRYINTDIHRQIEKRKRRKWYGDHSYGCKNRAVRSCLSKQRKQWRLRECLIEWEDVTDTRKQWEPNEAKISVSAGNRTQIVRFALWCSAD